MIMKRSSHIPTLTISAMTKRAGTEFRTLLSQRNCGATALQNMRANQWYRYGPVTRLVIMYHSYGLPLYHPMKISMT